tara:strand:+ start:83 stop:262 length:180 start_codon:yes stop_codon:yes gene_type:complete
MLLTSLYLHVLSLINTPIPAQRAIKILLHNLKTYGAGNAPNTEEFIKLLKALDINTNYV